jgi:hypothetical protein
MENVKEILKLGPSWKMTIISSQEDTIFDRASSYTPIGHKKLDEENILLLRRIYGYFLKIDIVIGVLDISYQKPEKN